MKFMSKKDCVYDGIKVYKNRTVVEFDRDVSLTNPIWYKVGESSPAPASAVEKTAKAISQPRITRIKK